MRFLWPFKKYHLEDFDSVMIPLSWAQQAASAGEEERGAEKTARNQDSPDSAVRNIEALRAEIDADVSASGPDSAYDRKAKVVNKALIDIGMGRYQWELFFLCGSGWFADNLCKY